jgi:hypothetical protein
MSTKNLPVGKGRPASKADNLTAICEPMFQKMLERRRLTTLWATTAYYRDNFTFFFFTLGKWNLCLYIIYVDAENQFAIHNVKVYANSVW